MKYLITGRSGSGKSAVCHELMQRGVNAHDTDVVSGLASWTDVASGKSVGRDYPGDDHLGKYTWDWGECTLEDLLSTDKDIFLCGSADNQLRFHHLFDRVFVLTLPPDVQRHRIMQRADHDYGKDPALQEDIIRNQKVFATQAIALGAVAINSDRPIHTVVDDILETVK